MPCRAVIRSLFICSFTQFFFLWRLSWWTCSSKTTLVDVFYSHLGTLAKSRECPAWVIWRERFTRSEPAAADLGTHNREKPEVQTKLMGLGETTKDGINIFVFMIIDYWDLFLVQALCLNLSSFLLILATTLWGRSWDEGLVLWTKGLGLRKFKSHEPLSELLIGWPTADTTSHMASTTAAALDTLVRLSLQGHPIESWVPQSWDL